MSVTPAQPVASEQQLRSRITTYIHSPVKRALRSGFAHLQNHAPHGLTGRTPLSFDDGQAATILGGFVPDIAYYDPNANNHARPNRVPGDCKPSYKWDIALQNSPSPAERMEFRQALSQVNWYMRQHHTRYGLIITDLQLVAIKRQNANEHLLLSRPILMRQPENVNNPQLTPLVALWYLGMLASNDAGWQLP